MEYCTNCPRNCKINRDKNIGYCGVSNNFKLARAGLHFGEEPIITGKNGSGAIFFSGCNLKCIYCQNYEISSNCFGKEITTKQFIDIIKKLETLGAENINLVSPTHYVKQIINALKIYKPQIPIIYNSNGYDSISNIRALKKYIDIYLVDLKYSDNKLAETLSKCNNYFEIATQNIIQMRKNQPEDIIINNQMKKGVIIRHLVLPNELENSKDSLLWISNFDNNTIASIMSQYTPIPNVKNTKWDRKLKPIEYKIIVNYAIKLGLKNSFVQQLDSADAKEIPDFNLTGLD